MAEDRSSQDPWVRGTTAERRAYFREPIELPVQLRLSDGTVLDGMMRDFCPGGVYIAHSATELRAGEAIEVLVAIPELGGKCGYPATVVRAPSSGFGIAFDRNQQELTLALRQARDRLANATRVRGSGLSSRIVATTTGQLQETTRQFLESKLQLFLQRIEDQLLLAASESAGPRQGDFFDAITVVRKRGVESISEFLQTTVDHLQSMRDIPLRLGSSAQDEPPEQLALIDQDEFENWLALSELVHMAESKNSHALYALENRLAELHGRAIGAANNPLSPSLLCQRIAEAIGTWPLQHEPRQLILGAFGQTVTAHLGELFERCNGILADAGVLPEPMQRPPAQKPRPSATRAEADLPFAAIEPSAGSIQAAARTLHLRRELQQAEPSFAKGAQFTRSELSDLISNLTTGEGSLRERVHHLLADQVPEPGLLGGEGGETLEIVDLLFGAMSNDAIVDPVVKRWIRRLDSVLLKVVLNEPGLLRDRTHPARRFINALGTVDLPDVGSRKHNELVARIEEVVERLVALQTPVADDFEQAADEIEDVLSRQHRQRSNRIGRILQAFEGQEKLNHARRTVDAALAEQLAGDRVPEVVVRLIDEAWRNLLVLDAVREGSNSEGYRSRLSQIKTLVRLLDPEPSESDADAEASAALLRDINENLIRVCTEAKAREEIVQTLREHLAGLRQGFPGSDLRWLDTEEVANRFPLAAADRAEEDNPDSPHAGEAKLLNVGDWITLENGALNEPMQLAWRGEDFAKHVFVTRDGTRSVQLTLGELSGHLERGKARPLAGMDLPLIDRSWREMLEQMHRELMRVTRHDPLTNAFTRAEFERRLAACLEAAKLNHEPCGALVVGIDDFRVVNEHSGHEAGDRYLRELAKMLKESAGEEAAVSRFSGDQFAILIPRIHLSHLEQLAEKIRRDVKKRGFDTGEHRHQVAVSVGVVHLHGGQAFKASEVLSHLDSTLRAAKKDGKDQVRSFRPEDDSMGSQRDDVHWVSRIERAFREDRFVLFAQEIHALREQEGRRFEILLRMREDDGTLVPADRFITAAETLGRIGELDALVLHRALALLADEPDAETQIERVNVNISGRSLSRRGVTDRIRSDIEASGISPDKIGLEITETAAMSNLALCADFIRELQEFGCEFTLDDFGSGMASFGYLKQLPVSFVKIDGSFIRDLHKTAADLAVVNSINEIAHCLGKKTVAEFVEHEEALAQLREMGVDFAQGFLFGQPESFSEILAGLSATSLRT